MIRRNVVCVATRAQRRRLPFSYFTAKGCADTIHVSRMAGETEVEHQEREDVWTASGFLVVDDCFLFVLPR